MTEMHTDIHFQQLQWNGCRIFKKRLYSVHEHENLFQVLNTWWILFRLLLLQFTKHCWKMHDILGQWNEGESFLILTSMFPHRFQEMSNGNTWTKKKECCVANKSCANENALPLNELAKIANNFHLMPLIISPVKLSSALTNWVNSLIALIQHYTLFASHWNDLKLES